MPNQKTQLHINYFCFTYTLFNDTFRTPDCVSSYEWMMVNNKLEKIRKKAVVTQFKIISQNVFGESGKTHDRHQGIPCPSRDSNRTHPTNKSEALLLEPPFSDTKFTVSDLTEGTE
jgi:hypothetical protein